ncbi:eIF2A domain-containing protein [Meloidogyne graminicola]|uniref:Eukaryotic translation initiation factor 2A n=1 Tax=Meloidogyne graminicola TaxID=189291 RepID=A0A8S9ZNQ7_9BILA|nr:eIF2A domain-containing protein [Meloidogyne graminicola]
MSDLIYAVRGSTGFSLKRGLGKPEQLAGEKLDPKEAHCRCFKFSNNGAYFSFCDSTRTALIEASTGRECFSKDFGKTQAILFSPKDKYMITYEPYVIYGTRMNEDGTVKTPNPNLRFWEVPTGKLLATLIADKQSVWKPYFTEDDSIAIRVKGSEILFYKNGNFALYFLLEKHSNKFVIKDIAQFSISPGLTPYMCCFIPAKNQPALIQLRSLNNDLDIIYTKASFNCDRCVMNWNTKGSALLVTASVDVDKSNQSYYGVSHIYCILTKDGGSCFQVPLDKEGPVHSVEWAPNSKEFCVCYGFMPSKVTIFNMRGDIIWDIGQGHRNEVHYNPQSTILVTCGFGNISSGRMEFWNLATRKEISQFCVPHTTHFGWAPDGQHICTSTTAPRLRTDNGYRIWTYQGIKIDEYLYEKEELWEIKWRPSSAYSKFVIEEPSKEQKEKNVRMGYSNSNSVIDNLPKGAVTTQGVYVPPHLRGKNLNNNQKGSGVGGGGKLTTNKKESGGGGGNGNNLINNSSSSGQSTEIEKKIRSLQKKLDDIKNLKERLNEGKRLEINQMEKIKNEEKILLEIEKIKLIQNKEVEEEK